MREQGTLVASRLWAEEGVGRVKIEQTRKTAVLRLRKRRDHPDPDPAQGGGGAAGLRKNG